nr:immunoglobulin heavy chain junction region [Mus musculus]MBK4183875.1 immunoglobulin heavy chain junction region [Mus musculus]MBK4183876.1 immunoglobulin heavy chain junction region [Mus musculus]MBK4183877.1 immunoglobulin heavy chain junction region [Mus musculus]
CARSTGRGFDYW